jgi:site-specific recombinase XerD
MGQGCGRLLDDGGAGDVRPGLPVRQQNRFCLGDSITEKVIWCIVKEFASKAQLGNLAPDDLRCTCARLCHLAGGELEQIQFLLGHVSVQTTEKYLRCK